jgi:hypothetical protein
MMIRAAFPQPIFAREPAPASKAAAAPRGTPAADVFERASGRGLPVSLPLPAGAGAPSPGSACVRASSFAGNTALGSAMLNGCLEYQSSGGTAYDLSTPDGRQALIAHSPQFDDLASTQNDAKRCGGASMANALIADGEGGRNAAAITKLAQDLQVQLTPDQADAVSALGAGRMTADQAANLQEAMLALGTALPNAEVKVDGHYQSMAPAAGDGGLTAVGVGMLADRLARNGAFRGSEQVAFTLADGHWTMSQTDRDGSTTYANSLPSPTGAATVGAKAPSVDFANADQVRVFVPLAFMDPVTSITVPQAAPLHAKPDGDGTLWDN